MKTKLFVLVLSLFVFGSCEKNTETGNPDNALEGTWNLVNLSGGFVGLNCDYPSGDITWIFTDTELDIVNNNNNPDPLCEAGLQGMFSYSILETENGTFLMLGENELGKFTISGNVLTINQNEHSTGSGADGFLYQLEK